MIKDNTKYGLTAKDKFESRYLSISDADETLLDKDEKGNYKDSLIDSWWYWFACGYSSAVPNLLQKPNKINIENV